MKAEESLEKGQRIDSTGFGDLRVIQNIDDFCYGIDSVILADFASRGNKGTLKIVELGAGNGALSLILSHKIEGAEITGVEVQKEQAELIEKNIEINQLEDRVTALHKDILDLPDSFSNTFNMVVTNPPYFPKSKSIINKNQAKATARHETSAGIKDFLEVSSRILKDKGNLYMIHRPSRLVDIIYHARRLGLEPKEIQFVQPTENEKANMVLIMFTKGAGAELRMLRNLCIYGANNEHTDEILKIYER